MNDQPQNLKDHFDEKFKEIATKEDINDLAVKMLTLEEFSGFKQEIRQDMALMRESIQSLTVSVDKLVKAVTDLKTEYSMVSVQLSRHEKWIQQLAEKLGLNLEY